MAIYAQIGVAQEVLEEKHEVLTSSQNIAYYTDVYDENLVINMPFKGKGASSTNAQ